MITALLALGACASPSAGPTRPAATAPHKSEKPAVDVPIADPLPIGEPLPAEPEPEPAGDAREVHPLYASEPPSCDPPPSCQPPRDGRCRAFFGYYWLGERCGGFSGCGGPTGDCGARFADLEECQRRYAHCGARPRGTTSDFARVTFELTSGGAEARAFLERVRATVQSSYGSSCHAAREPRPVERPTTSLTTHPDRPAEYELRGAGPGADHLRAALQSGRTTRVTESRSTWRIECVEPPPPPAPVLVHLRTSEPAWITDMDGRGMGQSPVSVSLYPGAFWVMVHPEEGIAESHEITVPPRGPARLSIRVEGASGR